MRLFQVVWDYIAGSLLTTKGDIVKRGAAVNARLGVGSAKEVLGVNDAGDDLEYRDGIEILTTQGDILIRDMIDIVRLPVGTAKEILVVNAAGDNLEYVYPANITYANEFTNENGAPVVVLAGLTLVTDINVGNVIIGDRLKIEAFFYMTKGGIGGMSTIFVQKSAGTGVVEYFHDRLNVSIQYYQGGGETCYFILNVTARVITAGTLTIALYGQSIGSNSNIPANIGQLYINLIKK